MMVIYTINFKVLLSNYFSVLPKGRSSILYFSTSCLLSEGEDKNVSVGFRCPNIYTCYSEDGSWDW